MSTSEIFGTASNEKYGSYITVRNVMDYTYHDKYVEERQLFQDKIVKKYISYANCTKSKEKRHLIFTAAPMGAGKSHVLKRLNKTGDIDLSTYVMADPDRIKHDLPEMKIYLHTDRKTAGTLLHKESAYIQELLFRQALHMGKSVIIDGTLKDVEWNKQFINSVRNDHPDYKISIYHVRCSLKKCIERAEKRGKITGREVPILKIMEAYEQVPLSIETLGMYVDEVVEYDNEEDDEDKEGKPVISP